MRLYTGTLVEGNLECNYVQRVYVADLKELKQNLPQ